MIESDPIRFWKTLTTSASFDSITQIDAFNRLIQIDILEYEHKEPHIALALGTLKLEVNKTYYREHGPNA